MGFLSNSSSVRKTPFQEKHVIQQASILGNLEKLGALKPSYSSSSVGEGEQLAVVEFGAGRGYLTQMLADCYGVSKVFLIERKSYKLKVSGVKSPSYFCLLYVKSPSEL